MNVIAPTVGRVVLVEFLKISALQAQVFADQPCGGMVTYVHTDRMINVAAFDSAGNHWPLQYVTLVQPGDEPPSFATYARWMDYQIGQAAKTEELQSQLAQAAKVLT